MADGSAAFAQEPDDGPQPINEPLASTAAWPPDYTRQFYSRDQRLDYLRCDDVGEDGKVTVSRATKVMGAKEHYRTRCIAWIEDWGFTADPRNAGIAGRITNMPFIMFPRQRELCEFILSCLEGETDGLIEKCRDMGATWICVGVSDWLWRFWPGVSVGWGSRKQEYVDRKGDMDSIFEKLRAFGRMIPAEFQPKGWNDRIHSTEMKIMNPENGASITGEIGDSIGRGGRKRVFFKDESAHYLHPELVQSALDDNTRCQIDISSVNGPGNVFHRKRDAGVEWRPGQPAIKGVTNVMVMDWRDHPAKDQLWYDRRRAKAIKDGLLHKFEQEVNRNYYAAVQGVIINSEHLKACIDAHLIPALKGEGWEDGPWHGALDVADNLEGTVGDRNAGSFRKGVVLRELYEWNELDVGATTRRAVAMCMSKGSMQFDYDSIGMGSAVKAERNRLEADKLMPKGVRFVPWDAGASPVGAELEDTDPKARVIHGDKDSPLVKDFYANFKAQGWWELQQRCWRTFQCVQAGRMLYPVDELISIPSDLPHRLELEKELCQPTRGLSGAMKMLVNKAPEGTKSPNLGDAVMMNYWPAKVKLAMVISDEVLNRTRRRAMVR